MGQSRFVATNKVLIAGPCSAESLEQVITTAESLSVFDDLIFRAGLWKPRTRPSTFEGVGEKGLEWLAEVKSRYSLKVCTEVASPYHVEKCLDYGIDALWIGARTTTNPFSVQDIAEALSGTDIPIFVKNPLNPDVKLWIGAIERLQKSGCKSVCAVHRGFSLADNGIYRQSPLWQIAIELRRLLPSVKLICDPSHMAGKRDLVLELAQTAMNLCYDGLMLEVHSSPKNAKTDSEQQLTPSGLKELLDSLRLSVEGSNNTQSDLEMLRKRIDDIDAEILRMLSERMKVVAEVSKVKKQNNISVLQINRWNKLLEERMRQAEKLCLDKSFVKDVFEQIHKESVNLQDRMIKKI